MSVDFCDAAERHWKDAGYLLMDSRSANADHLFGLSAECALKSVMQALGMPLRSDGAPDDKEHRLHINNLWDEFIAFAQNRGGVRYASIIDGTSNPFVDWNVNQRYDHRASITDGIAKKHQEAAKKTMQILTTAISDGGVV